MSTDVQKIQNQQQIQINQTHNKVEEPPLNSVFPPKVNVSNLVTIVDNGGECGQLYNTETQETVSSVQDFYRARTKDEMNNFTPAACSYLNSKATTYEEKLELVAIEMAKNKFLYQENTDFDSQVKKWNSLSEEERNKLVEQAKQQINSKFDKNVPEEHKIFALNAIFEDCQVANTMSLSYDVFFDQPVKKREAYKFNYIESLKNAQKNSKDKNILNYDQKLQLEYIKTTKDAIIDYIKHHAKGEERERLLAKYENGKIEDIQNFCEKHHIHPERLTYEYLCHKEKLTDKEQKQYKFLKENIKFMEMLQQEPPLPEGTITAFDSIQESKYAQKFNSAKDPKEKMSILSQYIKETFKNPEEAAKQFKLALRDLNDGKEYEHAKILLLIAKSNNINLDMSDNTTAKYAGLNIRDGSFNKKEAAEINYEVALYGNKQTIKYMTLCTGQRTDAVEVYKLSNEQIAKSEKATDEAKRLYAQYSLESLSSPEAIELQTKDLHSYNLDAFDKGVKIGLENIANRGSEDRNTSEASGASNPVNNSNTTTYNSIENTSQTNPIRPEVSSYITTEAKNISEQLTAGKVSVSEIAESFNKLSAAEKELLLKSIPQSDITKMPVEICAFCPEFIPKFVSAHKGIDIILQVPDVADIAIKCMKRSEDNDIKKQFNEFVITHQSKFMNISVESAKKHLGLIKEQNLA